MRIADCVFVWWSEGVWDLGVARNLWEIGEGMQNCALWNRSVKTSWLEPRRTHAANFSSPSAHSGEEHNKMQNHKHTRFWFTHNQEELLSSGIARLEMSWKLCNWKELKEITWNSMASSSAFEHIWMESTGLNNKLTALVLSQRHSLHLTQCFRHAVFFGCPGTATLHQRFYKEGPERSL